MNFNQKRKIDELEEGLNRNKNNVTKLNVIKNKIRTINQNNTSYIKRRDKLMEKVECPVCKCKVNGSNMNQHKRSNKHRLNLDPNCNIKKTTIKKHRLKSGHIRIGKKKFQFIYFLNGKRLTAYFNDEQSALLAQKYYIAFYPFIEFSK